MANLDFYALGEDLRDVLRFILGDTDIVFYESYSEINRELRQFRSLTELEAAFQLGAYLAGNLQLWSPSVMGRPTVERFELKRPDRAFRHRVEGMGLIQLYLSGERDGLIHYTHYGHWNEAGARQRSKYLADAEDCAWSALRKLSGRIQRKIRQLSCGKLYACPVLGQALNAVEQGRGLWFGPDIHRADSPQLHGIAPQPPRPDAW